MNLKEEEEIKKEFQLERVVLFTDAVFAIILTIMVLEIKLPEGLRHAPEELVRETFKEILLKFAAYVTTFALVARFWMAHLKLFKFLKDYDGKLIVLNLVFLFCVSLFPFAVTLITGIRQSLPEYNWAWMVYILVIYSSVFTQAIISRHLIINKTALCIASDKLENDLKWRIQRINMVVMPTIMLTTIIFNFFGLSFYYTLFPIIGYGVVIGRLTKKFYPEDNNGPLLVRLFKSRKTKKVIKAED